MKDETRNKKNDQSVRPTKKQFELLGYLRDFIAEHGYSPSYREIMRGCNYTSVATVALHINNLIKRGHVVKRDRSARSLEVVGNIDTLKNATSNHKNELVKEIENRFSKLEKELYEDILNEVYVLVGALKILGHADVSRSYAERIHQLQ